MTAPVSGEACGVFSGVGGAADVSVEADSGGAEDAGTEGLALGVLGTEATTGALDFFATCGA